MPSLCLMWDGRWGVSCGRVVPAYLRCLHTRNLYLAYNQINGSFPSVVSGLSSLR